MSELSEPTPQEDESSSLPMKVAATQAVNNEGHEAESEEQNSDHEYYMSISLNVLNHLGINLYSNVPAVLSEIVANAWDADATEVSIDINENERFITIKDNGSGMDKADINNKYLQVGYQKRKAPDFTGKTTGLVRDPMGRKGIGKLSVFSIANIVEVYSVKDGIIRGFRMSASEIKDVIDQQSRTNQPNKSFQYYPTPLPIEGIELEKGTLIVLKDIKRQLHSSAAFSRKRLARRFSIIGNTNNFDVIINGEPISVMDRDYFNKLEFVWFLGAESKARFEAQCGNAKKTEVLENKIYYGEGQDKFYTVNGWIGTFKYHADVDVDQDNNTVVLLARGKLIYEDIMKEIKEGRIFASYICGEIEADFLDTDDKEDIVTSDRQRILETDQRWEVLKDFFKSKVLSKMGNNWTDWRRDLAVETARELSPSIETWYDSLKGDNKGIAKNLFQKIEDLKVGDHSVKKELFKTSIMAFERLALTKNLSLIDSLGADASFEKIMKVFSDVDELEATHYYHITRGRLEVIEKFKGLSVPETKEKVLQSYIFEHLWLLNPTWERATFDSHMEQTMNGLFEAEMAREAGLTEEENRGRVDLKYRSYSGKHIVIELKKYNVRPNIHTLLPQVDKYLSALTKCLKTQFPHESPNVEIICVLGSPPAPIENDERNRNLLRELNARYVTYDQLIDESLHSYKDYLESQQEIHRIVRLIDAI